MINCVSHEVMIDIQLPSDLEVGCMMSSAIEDAIRRGGWEQCERARIDKFLPDMDVIEMGAGLGFISCITNRKLVNRQHIVIEANPLLIPILEHHMEINNITFTILNKAYNCSKKSVDFWVISAHENIVGIAHAKAFNVPAISLSEILDEYNINEYSLIMDIEGAEIHLIEEPRSLDKCKMIIIEIHPGSCYTKDVSMEPDPSIYHVDVNKFLVEEGFVLKDRCGCQNWVGVYENER